MKNRKIQTIIFIICTVFAVTLSFCLDSIPNRRFLDGDLEPFISFKILPAIFLLHGIVSGILISKSSKKMYAATTALLTFVSFFANKLIIDRLMLIDCLKIAAITSTIYCLCSIASFFLYIGIYTVFKMAGK